MALTKWSNNKAASMLQGNYDGYIQSSLLQLRLGAAISASAVNGAAVYNIKENTTYKVRLYMDTRFRIAATSSIAMNTVMTNYYRDAADKSDTTVAGAYKEAEITSKTGQVYMPVIYWASGGSKTWQEVFDTIEVREQLSGSLTLKSAPTKTEYNVGEAIDLTGLSVAVAWSDGSEEPVIDYTVSGFDSTTSGNKSVTVTYQEECVTFEVVVIGDCTVVFQDWDGTVLKTETVPYKGAATPPEVPSREGYLFTEWDSDFSSITSDIIITAQYRDRYKTYEMGDSGANVVGKLDLITNELVISGSGDMKKYTSSNCLSKVDEDFSAIKTVVIMDGVTSINNNSFNSCAKLISVLMHESVTSIGTHAFRDCKNLESITIPSGVTKIGIFAFAGCTNLNSVVLPNTITVINDFTFSNCTSLESIIIPESVTYIRWSSFGNCTSLKAVELKKGLGTIGTFAFEKCQSLFSIVIPDSVTIIEINAFGGCLSLKSIVIPENMTRIDSDVFKDCSELNKIIVLSKNCNISNSESTFPASAVIYGWADSTAEQYATQNSMTFIPIEEVKEHTVVFKGWDETVLKTEVVDFGMAATAPEAPVRKNYIFTGWSAEFFCITEDITTVAQYEYTEGILTGIEVTSLPEKIEYAKGEEFSSTGMVVSKVYSDGSCEAVTDYVVSGFNSSQVGEVVVSVSYGEYTASFTVTIVPPAISELKIDSLPDKVNYGLSDILDITGLIVLAVYTDGTQETVMQYTLSGYDSTVIGEKTIVISYQGYTTTFSVYVMQDVTVTFQDLYGAILSIQTIHYGHDAVPPTVSGFFGYVFEGWSNIYENVTEDTICRAKFKVQEFTVEFKDYDGTVLNTQQVGRGEDAVLPVNPSRTGFIFTGWNGIYTNITADTIITAVYTKVIKATDIQVSNIEMKNGDVQILSYTVLPENATDKTVVFESADKTIVGAGADGTLQANSVGTTTVTISARDGSEVKAVCTVTVISDMEVKSLWLLPNQLYMQVNKTAFITANLLAGPDADTGIFWTSSDSNIASVDRDGQVTGIAIGDATITARLKSDASVFATSHVEVIAEEDYIRELYADDSIHKELVIHSVGGRFADIINSDIVAESMVIKEAVSTSEPVMLGGCIANSFEVLVNAKRFFNNPPSGEIQVYQLIRGTRVELFNGIIDTAKRQEDKITRKLIAYDKMYSKGDINVAGWFSNLRFPLTIGTLRESLFKKIGIPVQSVSLPCDGFKIYQNYEYYTDEDSSSEEKKKRILYDIPDKLKASEVIRDICEVNGVFGWMNRVGAFEFIFPKHSQAKKLHPNNIYDSEDSCPVNAVEIFLDDKEVDPSITANGSYNDKQKYNIDDGNFIVSATRGATLNAKSYNSYQETYKRLILEALHGKNWVSCECRQRFDPTIRIGSDVHYRNQKYLSDGTQFVWETNSVVLERTINGIQSVTETITANIGYYSASGNKKKVTKQVKNNSKAISNLKSSIGSIGSDYYNGVGGGTGGGGIGGEITGGLKVVSVDKPPYNPDSNTIYLIQGSVVVE